MQSGPFSYGGEYLEQACEAEYRAKYLPECIHQVRMCFWCTVFVNLCFLFSDWRFYGQPHFYFAIAARTVLEGASLAGLAVIQRVSTFRQFQFVCIAWAGPVIASSAILVSPHTDIALFVTFILPALFYLAIPVSFRWALAFGFGSSAATLAAYMFPTRFSEASLGLVAGMLMSNAILVLVLSQSKRLRRLEWAATQAERVANAELSEHRDMLQKILRAVPVPLIITAQEDGKVIQVNDAAREYFGADLLQGSLKLERYLDHCDWTKLAQQLQRDGQVSEFEARFRLLDGSAKDVLLEATAVTVGGTKAILTVLVDITHRKEVEATMKRLANTDALSGLPNRARFFAVAMDKIKRAATCDQPLAVFMVDIDFFKRINDTHGHKAGDLTLKAFAELCRSWIRHQDIVARLGGEEFGFLLPETDTSSALALANRLRATVEGLRIDKILKQITISIGVSEVLPGEATVDAALSRADQAMYAAKRAGRNRAVLYGCDEFASQDAGRP
jgi:diguanylate cyclase (GGDEF)-like protein/PAS domain S-box-containing protein